MTPSGSTSNDQLMKAINSLTTAVNNISKMMSSSPNGRRPSGRPYTGGTSTGNGGINGDNTARRKRSVDDEYHRNRRNRALQSKSLTKLYFDFGRLNDEVEQLRKGYKRHSEDMDIAHKKQNEYVKALLESSKVTSKIQHGFQKQVDTMLKASKSTQHIKFQGTTPGARMKEVVNMQETAQGLIAQTNKLKSERKVGSVTALSSGDVKSLAKSMSDSGFSIEGMDLDKFTQRVDNHDHRIRQKKREIAHAKKHKFDPDRIKKMQDELGGLKGDKAKFLERTIGKTSTALEDFNKNVTSGAKATFHAGVANNLMENHFNKTGMAVFGFGAALWQAGKSLLEYAKYVRSLANQQIAGAHFDIALSSLMIGTSTTQFVKTMKQNMFQVTQLGFGGFKKVISDNIGSMHKLGLFGDEAVEALGDMTQVVTAMGVHPKDSKRFNAAFKDYADRANEMSKVTGISIKEYNALNNQLVNSTETSEMMLRLSAQEREAKVKSIIVERDRIAKMIGSNEQAAKFIETMQKVNADKFSKRIDNSMKVLQVSQYLGMGQDGRRLAAIMRKRTDELTPEEMEFRNNAMMELGKRMETAKKSGRLNEPLVDALEEILGPMAEAAKAGGQAQLSKEKNGSITKEQEAAMSKKMQIGEGEQAVLTTYAFWETAITNPIVKTLLGIVSAFAAYVAFKNKDRIIDFFKNGGIDKIKDLKNTGLDKVKNIFSGGTKALSNATTAAEAATGAATAASTAASASTAAAGAAGTASAAGSTTSAAASVSSKIAGAAKVAGKIAGIAGAVLDVGDGIMDLADGKRQTEMPSGWDMISPMRWGMWGGEKINQGAEWMLGDSLGSKIYDWTHGDSAVAATPAQTPGSRLAVGKITPAPNSDDAKKPSDPAINKPETEASVEEKAKQDKFQSLIDAVSTGSQTEQSKLDEMIGLLKTLIEVAKPENNGMLDALKNGSRISFNDIPNKRSLLASH